MAENVSRRCFLGVVAGTLGACGGGCLSGGLGRVSRGLRLGLLSDIHLCAEEGDFGKFGDASVFVHALEWFRDVGVDGVVVAGDIADNGMRSQLNRAGAAWRKVFPGNRAPDGSKVEKLFVYGNHDLEGQHYDGFGQRFFEKSLFRKGLVATDPAGAWEEAFGEKYEPIWLKWVRGVAVVGAHWVGGKWGGPGPVEEWFRAHAGEFGADAPLVYIQHPHLKDTCFGPSVWGHDVGCAGRALSGYRRAIALSGHAHLPATDDRFIWQGGYTSIGLGSLRYGCADGVQTLAAKGAKLLGQNSSWFTRQGMLLELDEDGFRLTCRDFHRDELVREPLFVPYPDGRGEGAFGIASRAAQARAPEWVPWAVIAGAVEGNRTTLSFATPSMGTGRLMGYNLTARLPDGKRELYCAAQPGYDLAPRHTPAQTVLSFDRVFPKGTRLEVSPLNAFGLSCAPRSVTL